VFSRATAGAGCPDACCCRNGSSPIHYAADARNHDHPFRLLYQPATGLNSLLECCAKIRVVSLTTIWSAIYAFAVQTSMLRTSESF